MKLIYKEILFQFIAVVLLSIFVAFDKEHGHFNWDEIIFLLNYVAAAIVINYVLLAKYYYKRKFKLFAFYFLLVVVGAVLFEEFVLEKIFYPHSRGSVFYFYYSFIEIAPAILLFVAGKFAWDVTIKQAKLDSMQRMMIENELDYLKQQINPHFLFNNLNNLYSYAIENSPKTPEIILQLSSILRYMLYDCREETVNISKEVDNIKAFVQLNELQLEGKGKVNFIQRIESDYIVSPLILIVFVENAFKHSLASQSEQIQIDIFISCKDEVLVLHCRNTFEEIQNLKDVAGGIGLQNVQSRLEKLYPDAHELKITKEKNLFSVDLRIQLKAISR